MNVIGTPPPASEVTPESLYLRRREFLKNAVLFTATSAGVGGSLLWLTKGGRASEKKGQRGPDVGTVPPRASGLTIVGRGVFGTDEPMTSERDVTTYNNFYEFGTDKSDPAENADTLRPRPWTVAIEGEVDKPQVVDVDQLLTRFPLE